MADFETEDFDNIWKSIQYNLTKENKRWKTTDLMMIYFLFGPVKTAYILEYIKSNLCKIYKLKETTISFHYLLNYEGKGYKVINGRCSCDVPSIGHKSIEISPCEHLVVISLLKSLKVNVPTLYLGKREFTEMYFDYSG